MIHDPVLIFALVMLIVLIAPLLFKQLRVPGLVGLILCGALVGPSGLNLLDRDDTIVLLGTVGLLYLMFVAGLALDLAQFNRLRSRSIVFGLLSFFIPQSLGIAAGIYLLSFSVPAALLLGSIVGSHTLLGYPIASRLGITKNRAVIMTMGGTIVTDMFALMLLAVVVAASAGALSLAFWIQFLGFIAVYLAAVIWGLPRVGRWFLRLTHGDANVSFVFLVTSLFVTAYLAQVAGLAPIIGAFLAGLVLNRLVPELGALMSRVKFVGETLFIPFFLLSVGMLVDFSVLVQSFTVWISAIIFTGIVLLGKGLAAIGAGVLFRHTRDETWAVYGLSVPQAAATLAVTLVGFNLGIFEEVAVNAVVVMILITCLIGPSLVERFGRRLAQLEESEPVAPSETPQRILIPLSNPATADVLVDVALSIRDADSEEPIYPMAVVRDEGDLSGQVASGEKLLAAAVVIAVAADVPVNPVTRVDMDVARGVSRAVVERRISHVVIGWGGTPSPTQRVFGSILDRLLQLTTNMILVCRLSRPMGTLERIVFAVPPLAEREPGFLEAVASVKRMANRIGTELAVVASARHLEAVASLVEASEPDVNYTTVGLSAYNRLAVALADHVTEDTLVVLLSSRETQLSWHPALDRLPRTVAQRYPKTDFIVMYPSAGDEAEDRARLRTGALAPDAAPSVESIHVLTSTSLPEAARELLQQPFGEGDLLEAAGASVLDERDYMLQELTPGVVLLHGHTAATPRQMILMGVSSEGVSYESMSSPAHILLILLNPPDLPSEHHLRALARLARAVHAAREKAGPEEPIEPATLIQGLHV